MKPSLRLLCLATFCATSLSLHAKEVAEPVAEAPPLIQVAILLDNSGSMGGLINQARTMIWDMVNDLATAERNGVKPTLEVALYQYGSRPVRMKGFTKDLDGVSESLFGLNISGGSEHCGEVILKSINELAWSDSVTDLKLVLIAGNEPFTQGPISYETACTEAINKAVVVNTIHCGGWSQGVSTKWQHGAEMTQGTYSNIDPNQVVRDVPAPQDKKLRELNEKFNNTFIAFGKEGAELKQRQVAQDANALKANSTVWAARCATKSGSFYNNTNWDLVDALDQKTVDLKAVKVEALPTEMQAMTLEQRAAYVATKQAERKAIEKDIKAISAERAAYVKTELARLAAETGEENLDDAFRQAVRKQGEARGWAF